MKVETSGRVGAVSGVTGVAGACLRGAEAWLDRTLTSVCGVLIVVQFAILLCGTIARYVFRSPFYWSEEVNSVLFLWLSIFGAVLASLSDGHMRLSVLVNRLSPERRSIVQACGEVIGALTGLTLLALSVVYVAEEWEQVTFTLSMPIIWKISALPVGFLLLTAIQTRRWHSRYDADTRLRSLAYVISVISLAALLWPAYLHFGSANLLVFFVLFLGIGVLAAVPIWTVFGLVTLAYLSLAARLPVVVVASRVEEGMSHPILLSVPLFVLLGLLLDLTGMAKQLITLLVALIGHVRGGLSYVLVIAMYLVSGISGSKAADIAAIAPVLVPEMKARGEHDGEVVALMATAAAMSETIPPSLVLIALGAASGVSIAALFAGGWLPALVCATALAATIFVTHREGGEDRQSQRPSARALLRILLGSMPVLVLPLVIRTAVAEGIATATEVATIGICYVLLYGIWAVRRSDWKRLVPILRETASMTGAILMILGFATAMSWALTQSGFSHELVRFVENIPGGRAGFLGISVVLFVALGCLLEGLPAIVLLCPMLFPVARTLGIHEVHYAMVVILSMGLGMFMPPLGVGFYGACAICKVDPDRSIDKFWKPLAALLIAIIVIAAFPQISLVFVK